MAAPVERVWEIFQDPDALCGLASSCEHARKLGDTRYEGTIRIRIAIFFARAHILGTVLRLDPPNFMRVAVEGRTTGVPGSFHGVAQLWLTEVGDTAQGKYVMDLDVLGRLGAMGQPLFQSAGQRLATTFAEVLSQRLQSTDSPSM